MRRNYKRVISLILGIIILTTFIGCYNYKDINKVVFVTTCFFDNEDGDVAIYLDCVKPFRDANDSSDKGKRILYKGKSKTILEGIRDINLASSYKINFTQCKAYIFSENAAKSGLEKYLDLLRRDQELLVKPYLFVYFGDVKKLFETANENEEYLGIFLNDLAIKVKENPKVISTNINDFFTERSSGRTNTVISALEIVNNSEDNKLSLSGGAILNNDILVERLTEKQTLAYSFLNDNVDNGVLEVSNPQDPKTYITLEINNSKTETKIKYDGDRIKLYKYITINCSIAEVQDRFIINDTSLKKLEETEKKDISQYISSTFDFFRKKEVDIFEAGRYFNMYYPKESIEGSIIGKTDLILTVDVNIEGSSEMRDSY
ncbi:Ger(x)C family spore germination protein [Clostridium fallax]|uniref:Germination protein, Ger(X)C family n=1 Tax=Clostridium fallax TaxID=1533 RepID=A0A1M4SWY2_9CLOT|nr:Ger(x)C family spore germination protein [Clostridium fallax]SHE36690.1 germination protein, Ger(x)C family [Clostridium fallax]SQB08009.1 spore germination protein B3 [Clostridium fallax]